MRLNIKLLLLVILSYCMVSCDTSNMSLLPNVTGQSYDLLVVGSDKVWRALAGEKLSDALKMDMPGLAQSEQFFTVSFVDKRDFGGIFKPVRNILFFDVDSTQYTQVRVTYSRDRWAESQAIATITVPNEDSLEVAVDRYQETIRRYFVSAECDRALKFYATHKMQDYMDSVYKKFGASIVIPNHLRLSSYAENFAWFSNGNINLRQDIIVYKVPYKAQSDFLPENILRVRDSVLKLHIPGPSDGSYMTTEYRYIPPVSQALLDKSGRYSMEIRGLWRVEGDLMGGPFVSRTYLDADCMNLVTAEAFIYSPNQKKRTAYRQLEAMISGVTFPDMKKDTISGNKN